jgi:RimJ/RimL family protein N-acetyltransferase
MMERLTSPLSTKSLFGPLHAKLRTVLRVRRLFGCWELCRSAGLFILEKCAGYRAALVFVLPTAGCPYPALLEGLSFSFLEPEQIDRGLIAETDWTVEQIQEKALQGRRFFVGVKDGRQCYFSVTNSLDFTIGGRFRVQLNGRDQAYVGGGYTPANYRGQGILPLALQSLAKLLAAEGKSWLFAHIEVENLSSMRGARKAGFRPVAKASVFRCPILRRKWRMLPLDKELELCGAREWSIVPALEDNAT